MIVPSISVALPLKVTVRGAVPLALSTVAATITGGSFGVPKPSIAAVTAAPASILP